MFCEIGQSSLSSKEQKTTEGVEVVCVIVQCSAWGKTHHDHISLLQLQSDSIRHKSTITIRIVGIIKHDPFVVPASYVCDFIFTQRSHSIAIMKKLVDTH